MTRTSRSWPVAGLAMLPAAANGLGRFAYGLVLPPMRQALEWSPLTAGVVGTVNLAGYLLGAVVTNRLLERFGVRRAALGALSVVTLSVAGCATTGSFAMLFVLRLVNGVAAAVTFVAGAVLVARLADGFSPRAAGRFLGLYFAGPGIGIAVSAPLVTAVAADGRWRLCWLLLGSACAVCAFVGGRALRCLEGLDTGPDRAAARRAPRGWDSRRVAPLVISYGVFGAGYTGFMTFVVAYLRATGRVSTVGVTVFWFVLGAAGVAIGVTAMVWVGQARGGRGVALLTAVVAAASAVPLVSDSLAVIVLAAALFGSFFSITAAATAGIRQQLPADQWAPAIAGLTAAFGVGQCVGPVLSGALSSGPAGFRVGLLTGTALLAVSSLCALLQRPSPLS